MLTLNKHPRYSMLKYRSHTSFHLSNRQYIRLLNNNIELQNVKIRKIVI